MVELLPLSQAQSLRENLSEFLTTTFSVSEPATRQALNEFLEDPKTGLFKGPYTRIRLPFAPSEDDWAKYVPTFYESLAAKGELTGPEVFRPYGHQVQAWKRLTTADGHHPEPTLVTTGTGSGKTEAFLMPILDHCARANEQGVTGTKAIILYPMNALANDQASRLAELISGTSQYEDITAAIYTGEQKSKAQRTKVSKHGLINNQDVIRSDAPDILLTNYKMLDHLLLRHADAKIWQQSADSLTYLVLDEFHAYDGAQGTDVAMLLRRLGLTLKAQAGALRADNWKTPLGPITPVATSATMGGKDDVESMLGFASQVLGIQFDDDAVIRETRMSWQEWAEDADTAGLEVAPLTVTAVSATIQALKQEQEIDGAVPDQTDPAADPGVSARLTLSHLYADASGDHPDLTDWSDQKLLNLVKAHPVFEQLQAAASKAAGFKDLVEAVFGTALHRARRDTDPKLYVSLLLTTLSHLRARLGRKALSIDVHVWVREVSRMDRVLSNDAPQFRWSDDGEPTGETEAALPAIYCRSCGRTGWQTALEPTGENLDLDDAAIRKRTASSDPRTRALIHAKAEAEVGGDKTTYMWLLSDARSFEAQDTTTPADDSVAGERIPVFVDLSEDGNANSQNDVCPSCGAPDSIRFLGSAAATLLSVSLSGLLGTPNLDKQERKALVFTDSVQDAAHRAGFIQARSHALTLRTAIRESLTPNFVPSTDIAGQILIAADASKNPAETRFALLPPQLEEDRAFEPFWKGTGGYTQNKATENMRRRLGFDVGLEFGLRSAVGRTLENTGTATVRFTHSPAHLLAVVKRVVRDYMTAPLTAGTSLRNSDALELSDADLLRWVYGALQHMRTNGAVSHRWYEKYRDSDGARWWLTGGRLRAEGMPGFGGRVGMPRFPISRSIRTKYPSLEPTPVPSGWYGTWTGKTLGAPASERGTLARELLEALAADGLVNTRKTESGASTYAIEPEDLWVRALKESEAETGDYALQCDLCGETTYGDETVTKHLTGGPCLAARCSGKLRPLPIEPNFYQSLYRDSGLLKVVAREHTSLLPDKLRVEYEDEFKSHDPAPNAPNVLVATPTLELGIDIGDLSAVMLSSLPKTVASYLQRVGRAGRLTGNSLTVAFVTSKGNQLPLFQKPLETINGEVLPPNTFLQALEILKRQYIAAAADRLARDKTAIHPTSSKQALARGEDTYLDALVQTGSQSDVMEDFLSMFVTPHNDILPEQTKEALRNWARPKNPGKHAGVDNPSGLWQKCEEAALVWEARIEDLSWRIKEIQDKLPELEEAATSPSANQESQTALRTAYGALSLARKERADLTGQYWVSTLEGARLFPNYTLLDDSVTLDVTLSWIEPETQQWQEGDFDITRGSAQALRDFAPGSTFYVRGLAINVDAIDLGRDRHAVELWAMCAACGYVAELGVSRGRDATASHKTLKAPPPTCPRCGDERIGDAAQQLHVVQLERVSAVMRRDKAQISDTMADRRSTWFEVADVADMDPSHTTSWYVEGEDFGVRHSTFLTMRWLNLGKRLASGEPHVISGYERTGPQFTVCDYCGQEDTTPDANNPKDHRPWCPRRNDIKSSTVRLSLARKLEGEGLFIRIPQSMTVGHSAALSSLMAAVHMALEMRLGRADHLAVTEAKDPSGAGVGSGILIYDTIPGGTGYLGELAALSEDGKPHSLWQILKAAYDQLNRCTCANGELLACQECLLPYAPRSRQPLVSREVAAHLLGELLAIGQTEDTSSPKDAVSLNPVTAGGTALPPTDIDDEILKAQLHAAHFDPWPHRTKTPPTGFNLESFLEGAFRATASDLLREQSWNVKVLPAPEGDSLIVSKDQMRWRLDPQVTIGGTKPDFLLSAADPNVPETAIYTDGRQYHFAPAQFNRVGDDSTKRAGLREQGYRVLAVTAEDVRLAERALQTGIAQHLAPKWFSQEIAEDLVRANLSGLSAQSFQLVDMDALHLLENYMSSPENRHEADQLAKWLPLFFIAKPGRAAVSLGPNESLLQATYSQLTTQLTGQKPDEAPTNHAAHAYVWTDGSLAVGVRQVSDDNRTEIVVLLEDTADYVGTAYEDYWRSWLHISNLLNGRTDPTIITTTSRMKDDHAKEFLVGFFEPDSGPAAQSTETAADEPEVPAHVYAGWQSLMEDAFEDEEKALQTLMTQNPALPLPEVGGQTTGGQHVPIGWLKHRVALAVDLEPGELETLTDAGWMVVETDAEAVEQALESRGL